MQVTGRPTKYTRDCNRIARKVCELGGTDEDIAKALDVSLSTVNLWKLEHNSFSESITKAKLNYDTRVERALFERATGYSHPEVDIRTVSVGNGQSEIVQTPITKHYPPDPVSMIFWLKNRQPERWKDVNRSEVAMIAKLEVSGSSVKEIEEQLVKRGVLLPGVEVKQVEETSEELSKRGVEVPK